MRRTQPWLLLIVAVPGCIDRQRVNASCEWTGDRSGSPERAVHVTHGPAFDLAAGLTFLPIYAFGSFLACGWLGRRLSSDSRLALVVATGLSSAVASVAGLQAGQLWSSVWEVGRVGNGHISSFRMATSHRWSQPHLGALFVAGVLLFWTMALLCHRRGTRPRRS